MNEPAFIFGAALDYLDDPDRLGLKLAYLEARAEGRLPPDTPLDPYDVLAPIIVSRANGVARASGKIAVPGWLTPRPLPGDRPRLDPAEFHRFISSGGIGGIVELCRQRAAAILPSVPVMIAVDHALCAGAIRAAAERYGPEDLAVVVLDAHFDAIPPELRAAAAQAEHAPPKSDPAAPGKSTLPYGDDPPDFISDEELADLSFEPGPEKGPAKGGADDGPVFPDGERDVPEPLGSSDPGPGLCGDFLAGLLSAGTVLPGNLWVVGVSDYPPADQGALPYAIAYQDWIARGVRVYRKSQAQAPDFGRRLAAELGRSKARRLYVSLDADVGAGVCMNAVRFLDRMGLTEDRIMGVAHGLRELIEYERFHLAGLDICEIEVHLLGLDAPAACDPTAQVPARFAAALLGNMTFAAGPGK